MQKSKSSFSGSFIIKKTNYLNVVIHVCENMANRPFEKSAFLSFLFMCMYL